MYVNGLLGIELIHQSKEIIRPTGCRNHHGWNHKICANRIQMIPDLFVNFHIQRKTHDMITDLLQNFHIQRKTHCTIRFRVGIGVCRQSDRVK